MLNLLSSGAMLALNPTSRIPGRIISGSPALAVSSAALTTTSAAYADVVDNPYARSAAGSSSGGGDFIGDLIGNLGNGALTIVSLGLLLYILSVAFEALTAVASGASSAITDGVDVEDDDRAPPQDLIVQDGALYDDSGTGSVTDGPLSKKAKEALRKKSFTGDFAPWMTIDPKKIEQAKKEREQRRN